MTPCAPRLQLQTFMDWGKCLAKVLHNIETSVLGISTPVRMSSLTPTPDFMGGVHFDMLLSTRGTTVMDI